MKQRELDAVKKAITAAIKEALENVLVRPFPSTEPRDYGSIVFHAMPRVEAAVMKAFQGVVGEP
jgi:hypothetical protein